MSTPLRVVTTRPLSEAAPIAPANLSGRIQGLQAEAKRLAREHIAALAASLAQTHQLADEIAQGGDAYPPGVRDIARRLCEENAARAMTIEAITARF